MTSADESSTRREVLIGGAAGVGIITAGGLIAACAADDPLPDLLRASERVVVARVSTVPVDDPASSTWDKASEATIALEGQLFASPTRPEPFVPAVVVRAVHDGTMIGFRLTWADAEIDDLTIKTDSFRDACAVLLGDSADNPAVRVMGTVDSPATILHWKADWQRDVDLGFQGLAVAFPNGTFDYYPPHGPSDGEAPMPADYTAADAEQWLPAMAVDNPLSQPTKASPVEKTLARGFGTLDSLPTQDATGRGAFSDGHWNVVLAKQLSAADDGEVVLSPGGDHAIAVAVWSGRGDDAGGHKSPAQLLLPLRLES